MGDWTSRDLITESLTPTGSDFDGMWFDDFGSEMSLEGTIVKMGSYSIKAHTSARAYVGGAYFITSPVDFTNLEFIEFWVYNPDISKVTELEFSLANDRFGGWRQYECTEQVTNDGWTRIKLRIDDYYQEDAEFDISSVQFIYMFAIFISSGSWDMYIDGMCLTSTVSWTGGGADELWATVGNWEGGNVPDIVGEAAKFTGAQSNKNCTIGGGDTPPGAILIESDYTGIVNVLSGFTSDDTDLYVDGGTLSADDYISCRDLKVTGGYVSDSLVVYGPSVHVSGSGVILDRGITFWDTGSVDVEVYQTGTLPADPRIDGLDFKKDGTINLLTDVYSDADIELGWDGLTTVLNVGSNTLGSKQKVSIQNTQLVDLTITFASGGMLWVNMGGANYAEDLYGADGSSVTIGASGGEPWTYRSSRTSGILFLGYYERTQNTTFYGPSEGGAIDIPGSILACYNETDFISYGGDINVRGVYSSSVSEFDLDESDLTVTGDMIDYAGWLPGVDQHSMLSLGTWSSGPTSSLTLTDIRDNVVQGIDVWNVSVDSGGVGITVTASGTTIRGALYEGPGDSFVLGDESYWETAKVKWIGLGANDNWTNVDNWQAGHIPDTDDIAWYTGAAVRNCLVDSSTPVPTEILVEADYTGALAIINSAMGGWGSESLKLTVYGSRNDYFGLSTGYTGMTFGDVYIERGRYGEAGSFIEIYGDLYFAGNFFYKILSVGTNDRTWSFDTAYPPVGGVDNYIWYILYDHYNCTVSLTGNLAIEYHFIVDDKINDDLDVGLHLDGNLQVGRQLFDPYPWEIYSNIYFTIASGSKIIHGNSGYSGFLTTGRDDNQHRRFEIGASGSGLWDFDGSFTGEDTYGGYSHRLRWGYVLGMMPRWHQKLHYPEYAKYFGPGPGYFFKSRECGLHIGTGGQFISYGGDIEAKWLEVTERGYFNQADSKLTITGKAVSLDLPNPAPGEPDIDHKWAIWSTGTWVWTPGASIDITSPVDCELWNATLPNLTIDSGGAGITVTASGCSFYGQPTIAEGDRLIILGGSTIVREIIPELGITRKEGDHLITELDVIMEGD